MADTATQTANQLLNPFKASAATAKARIRRTHEWSEETNQKVDDAVDMWAESEDEMPITELVRNVGGGLIVLGIVTVVLNEVFTIDAVNNSTGPFGSVITDAETTGAAALGLVVVVLLIVVGNYMFRFF